jgi:hypothetical protein
LLASRLRIEACLDWIERPARAAVKDVVVVVNACGRATATRQHAARPGGSIRGGIVYMVVVFMVVQRLGLVEIPGAFLVARCTHPQSVPQVFREVPTLDHQPLNYNANIVAINSLMFLSGAKEPIPTSII